MQLVEANIANEIKSTRVALMYDAWTRNGTNYRWVYLVCIMKVCQSKLKNRTNLRNLTDLTPAIAKET